MQPSEKDELSDQELNDLLLSWKEPTAPARLRAAVFPEASRPSWQSLWRASIRVPVPVAACLAIMLALAAWRWFTPVAPRVVVKPERVDVPVQAMDVHALRPVAELRPRIIRGGNGQN